LSWKSWRLLQGFEIVDAITSRQFWWQFDLVGGAGRWICGRYIRFAADDARTERTETSACEIVGLSDAVLVES
jgi:hypothetical protein